MRWFMVELTNPPETDRPYVVAECVDQWWAKDQLRLIGPMAVLSEQEMELDPEFAPALACWRGKDDTAYAAYEAQIQTEMILQEAEERLTWEREDITRDPDSFTPVDELLRQRFRHLLDEFAAFREGLPYDPGSDVALYYWVGATVLPRLHAVEGELGEETSASIARQIARDLAEYSREHGVRAL